MTQQQQYDPPYQFPVNSSDDDPGDWIRVQIQLKFDDPITKEHDKNGQQWTSYMYRFGLIDEGREVTHFATPGLHKKFQELGATKNTVLSVCRAGEGMDTRWYVKHVGGPVRDVSQLQQQPSQSAPQPQQQQTQPQSKGETIMNDVQEMLYQRIENLPVARAMLEDFQFLFKLAYEMALEIIPEEWEWSTEDYRAFATSSVIDLRKQTFATTTSSSHAYLNRLVLAADVEAQTEEEVIERRKACAKAVRESAKNFVPAIRECLPRYRDNEFARNGAIRKVLEHFGYKSENGEGYAIPGKFTEEEADMRERAFHGVCVYADMREAHMDGDAALGHVQVFFKDGRIRPWASLD